MSNEVITKSERKRILIDMLISLSDFFCRHDIRWYIAYGTLIGTIRHGGFIPWDDDIDIVVPRPDYVRLIHILEESRQEIEEKHLVLITYTPNVPDGAYYGRLKIADDRTYTYELGQKRAGVFIDIFVLDTISDIKKYEKEKKWVNLQTNLCDLCLAARVRQTSLIKRTIYSAILFVFKALGIKAVLDFFEQRLIRHNIYNSANYYANPGFGYGLKDCVKATCYQQTIMKCFEGVMVPCPVGYDEILSSLYGDYMSLPPADERVAHDDLVMYWR